MLKKSGDADVLACLILFLYGLERPISSVEDNFNSFYQDPHVSPDPLRPCDNQTADNQHVTRRRDHDPTPGPFPPQPVTQRLAQRKELSSRDALSLSGEKRYAAGHRDRGAGAEVW